MFKSLRCKFGDTVVVDRMHRTACQNMANINHAVRNRSRSDPAPIHAPPDGFLHPLAVIKTLQQEIPKTAHVINTSGYCAFILQMNAHPQSHYTVIRDFGAINGTSFALGIAERYPNRPVILLDGDGSVMMHIQELETMARHGLNIMTVVLNDGGYGSEVHKLRLGCDLAGSVFGRPDFAAVARVWASGDNRDNPR